MPSRRKTKAKQTSILLWFLFLLKNWRRTIMRINNCDIHEHHQWKTLLSGHKERLSPVWTVWESKEMKGTEILNPLTSFISNSKLSIYMMLSLNANWNLKNWTFHKQTKLGRLTLQDIMSLGHLQLFNPKLISILLLCHHRTSLKCLLFLSCH